MTKRFESLKLASDSAKENLEKAKNVSELETPAANYRIIYNHHKLPLERETIAGADGVVLELIGMTQEDVLESTGLHGELDLFPETMELYTEIILAAAERCTPIFFAEVTVEGREFIREKDAFLNRQKKSLATLELIGGLLAAVGAVKIEPKEKEKPGMSRRAFISNTLRVMAGWAVMPFVMKYLLPISTSPDAPLSHPDERSALRKFEKSFGRATRAVHPEMREEDLEARNLLTAQKSETIAGILAREKGSKPNLAITLGADHYGIEQDFKAKPAERAAKLKEVFGNMLQRESSIVRVDFEPYPGDKRQRMVRVSTLEDASLTQ